MEQQDLHKQKKSWNLAQFWGVGIPFVSKDITWNWYTSYEGKADSEEAEFSLPAVFRLIC
jgi:hypothetical protein